MKYTFSINAPQQQFISISVEINTAEEKTILQFPTWRPGRYQIADFAKNTKLFNVFDENGKHIAFKKLNKSAWEVDTANTSKIKVNYKYYAAEMNAGATYLDEEQLYVNPVNCCIYDPKQIDNQVELYLDIKKEWSYAGALEKENNLLTAINYDELVDSPFICSEHIQHNTYEVGGVMFHIWFNGIVKPDWNKLLGDFEAFTSKQLEKFLEFPTDEYHFIFQILPYQIYHGVEHERSTVITLGPSYAVFDSLYKELLGVSSHELYHTWNVKAIRPAEMLPYDFSKENFTELGYIAEGVTTYQGDLFLLKSGVFNLEQYLKEMNAQLQKHFDNFGRFNYSVADSSWDTWLDGYEPGVPGRKVSIYTEGCLLAFVVDVMILKSTENIKKLDNVMRSLYFDFAQRRKGVTKEDFKAVIENIAETDFSWLFDQYYYGTKAYETILTDCFEYLGLTLNQEASQDTAAAYLGVKTSIKNNQTVVNVVYPGGPLDLSGIMIGDKILAINNITINNDLQAWVKFFKHDTKQITIDRKGTLHQFSIPETDRIFYKRYWLSQVDAPDKNQQFALRSWMS